MDEEEFSELNIDCSTGDAVELVLDEHEAAPILELRQRAAAERQEQARYERALARLRERAAHDLETRDWLIVLGLEE